MTVDEYLINVLKEKSNNYQYSDNEKRAEIYIKDLLNKWKQTYNSRHSWYLLNFDILMSGSRAKGDAIKGKSDIDIFVSITDTNNIYTVKDYYEDLFDFLKDYFTPDCIRKQNVSIGLKYAGCSIDVTPGKRINRQIVTNGRYSDHYIYSRKNDSITKTNIQVHIELVRNSGLANVMMLLKIWRNCHGLELPSIAIEIITCEILKECYSTSLYEKFKTVLEGLRDTILDRRIIDPANTNNNIADTLTREEKIKIRDTAIHSLSQDHGKTVSTSKILW